MAHLGFHRAYASCPSCLRADAPRYLRLEAWSQASGHDFPELRDDVLALLGGAADHAYMRMPDTPSPYAQYGEQDAS